MNATHAQPVWQRGAPLGLALLGFLAPLGTTMLRTGFAVVGGAPPAASDYRLTVAVLVLGSLSALVALLSSRVLAPAWLRRLSSFLAGTGLLLSLYLLWSLIGLCGVQVLWSTCTP